MNEWLLALLLGLLAGAAVLVAFLGLALRPRRIARAQPEALLPGIQVRLDRAKLGVKASTYITRSLAYGAAFGLLMWLATGALLVFPVGLAGGFAFVWARLEDERNEWLNRYHKGLASAADTIVNSWRIKPSMNRALEAVAVYGHSGVAGDFAEVRRAVRGGEPLVAALQAVADRRESPVFDALATALVVAEEAGGEVSEMLARHARATRRMAEIYEETLSRQRGVRTDVMWGIVGPWGVMALVRVGTILTGGLGYGTEFFQTLPGQVVAMVAALLTVAAYIHAHRTAGRGLIVERVPAERGQEGKAARQAAPQIARQEA